MAIDLNKKIEKIDLATSENAEQLNFSPEKIGDKQDLIAATAGVETDSRSLAEKAGMEKKFSNQGVGQPGIDTSQTVLHQQVESVLEGGLENIYFALNEEEQNKFKLKGEQTAKKIVELIEKTKVNFRKIFKLICDWLKIIPGKNKFFVEQEAKIKADKIIKLAEDN